MNESAANWITSVSNNGSIVGILIAVLILLTILIGIGLIGSLVSGRRKNEDMRFERLDALLGRFERSERTLNEFRSEALRHLEISRNQLDTMRGEFEEVHELLRQHLSSGIREPELEGSLVERKARARRASHDRISVEDFRAPIAPPEAPPEEEEEPAPVTPEPTPPVTAPSEPAPETLSQRLKKTRASFFEKIRTVFTGKPKLDEEAIDELEALLVGSDMGIKISTALLTDLREDIKNGSEVSELGLAAMLKQKLLGMLERGTPQVPITAPRRRDDGPIVVLIVGVNGAGKTTTVAKLAHQWLEEGSSVLMVAADTFRAAAVEQLHEWGRRLGAPVVSGAPDAKPQTVVFDAMLRAKQEPVDVVLIDTAGRLHTKENLMQELEGVRNAITRHFPSAPDEVLLVVDGSSGQNALVQAREFNAATQLSGVVVTKLDGTSKGGIVVAIKDELGIPVRYIGVGEGKDDLRPFVPRDFVEAIFDTSTPEARGELSVNAETRRRRRAEANA